MWKQQMIRSLLPGKRRNMQKKKKKGHNKGKFTPSTSNCFLTNAHITHIHAHAHTHTLARYAKHSPCVNCVYVCMSRPLPKCSAPVRGQTLLWLWKLPACPSHPCLSCDSALKAARHAHFLQITPSPPPTKQKKKKHNFQPAYTQKQRLSLTMKTYNKWA